MYIQQPILNYLSNSFLICYFFCYFLYSQGSEFIVVWENVSLQDKQKVGKFTFSATLHKNGDITFIYYKVPIMITTIQDVKHPVKVGLSDAYIIDKMVFCEYKSESS